MKATEAIEDLERLVYEFGDGELQVPDPLERRWCNPVDRIERHPEGQGYLLVSDR